MNSAELPRRYLLFTHSQPVPWGKDSLPERCCWQDIFENIKRGQDIFGAPSAGISHHSVPPVQPRQGGAPKVVSVLNAHVAKLKLAGMATSGLVVEKKTLPKKMRVDLCILKRLTKNTYFFWGGHVNCYLMCIPCFPGRFQYLTGHMPSLQELHSNFCGILNFW